MDKLITLIVCLIIGFFCTRIIDIIIAVATNNRSGLIHSSMGLALDFVMLRFVYWEHTKEIIRTVFKVK